MEFFLGTIGAAIGTGAQNTIDIITGCTTVNKAADICANHDDGTYDDWFLPSKDELNEMYVNLHQQGLGGFANNFYWSSTEFDDYHAWIQGFFDGFQTYDGKDFNYYGVRAVRAF
jgi:hypothetical protein